MRILDRFISFIFTLLVIILAVTIFLGATDIISYDSISSILNDYIFVADPKLKLEIAAVSILVILLGLKITVFSADLSNKTKKNIVVNTNHGKIQISQDTIEEIATSVAREHSEIKEIAAKMAKAGRGINMYLMLTVYKSAQINELLSKVQTEVKNRIETSTNVNVCSVDIKIKNIVQDAKNVGNDKKINIQETIINNEEKNTATNVATIESTNENLNTASNTNLDTSDDIPDGYMRDSNNILYKVEPNINVNNDNN